MMRGFNVDDYEFVEGCESGRVTRVPVIVKPVVVPVPPVTVPIEVTDIQVAIGVPIMYKIPSEPPPSEYSLGCILYCIIMHQYFAPSIFIF